jgi:hypothetical protein
MDGSRLELGDERDERLRWQPLRDDEIGAARTPGRVGRAGSSERHVPVGLPGAEGAPLRLDARVDENHVCVLSLGAIE